MVNFRGEVNQRNRANARKNQWGNESHFNFIFLFEINYKLSDLRLISALLGTSHTPCTVIVSQSHLSNNSVPNLLDVKLNPNCNFC